MEKKQQAKKENSHKKAVDSKIVLLIKVYSDEYHDRIEMQKLILNFMDSTFATLGNKTLINIEEFTKINEEVSSEMLLSVPNIKIFKTYLFTDNDTNLRLTPIIREFFQILEQLRKNSSW